MKHLVAMVAGSGLSITGAILLSNMLSQLDWVRINQYGFFHEIGARAPIIIPSAILTIVGIIIIFGAIINILFHDGVEDKAKTNK